MSQLYICLYVCVCFCVCVQSLSHVQLFVTPWIAAHQVPLSMGFSRQEYWSGLPFPPPGELLDPGIEPVSSVSPVLQADFLPLSHWITTKWKIHQEMGIPDYFICLLRNLYAGQEATVKTRHGTTDWFQLGKGVHQGCILSPCLFNLYAECIMRNARLDEAQAGIKIVMRNINNLRYADDTTLMAESEEELRNLLIKVREESEKSGLKLNI